MLVRENFTGQHLCHNSFSVGLESSVVFQK